MSTEIERKFLLADDSWKINAHGVYYRQGYVATSNHVTVRVRIAGDRAFLTLKSPVRGISRGEFEYPVPLEDAVTMLDTLCETPQIVKYRYLVDFSGHRWEIDEFLEENAGLVVAEIELRSESESFARPPWLGREVTGDAAYYNSMLCRHPYCEWLADKRRG